LLEYPEDSAGRLITPAYLAIRPDWTVQQTLDHVRAYGRDRETINALYVLDDRGVLLDDIRISDLLLAALTARITELMDRNFVALNVTDTKDTAVAVFRREDRTVLPVVEADGRLVGIITADDVLDVAEAAATEDIHKIGGMEAFDEPYFEISFSRMIRKRAGWLVLLFLGEMLWPRRWDFSRRRSHVPLSWHCSFPSSFPAAGIPARRLPHWSSARSRSVN
jgi:magnesium transporter